MFISSISSGASDFILLPSFDSWPDQQWEPCMSSFHLCSHPPRCLLSPPYSISLILAAWGWQRGGGEAPANILLWDWHGLSSHLQEGPGQTRTAHPALDLVSMDHGAVGKFSCLYYVLHVWFLVELTKQTSQLFDIPPLVKNSPTWLNFYDW